MKPATAVQAIAAPRPAELARLTGEEIRDSTGLGSAWNTMPAHTHGRRSEIYFYFDLTDNIAVRLPDEPGHTGHPIVRDRQAALSSSYRFIWA